MIDLVVGEYYNLSHRYVGNIVTVYKETLEKIVKRKDGIVELRFSHHRRTFYPIGPKKQYGIIKIERCNN